jgi:type VI secretion system secreted protein Hcp
MNKQLLLLSIGSIATVMLLVGASQEAEAAGYMKIAGIEGESTDESHKEWIDLLSFSHEINRESKASGAARTRGGATFGDIMVVKEVDKSTPKLQEAIAMGTAFPLVEIEFTRSVGERGEDTYLKYELKNVLVSSYSFSGAASGNPIPTDTISMTFKEIKVTYTQFDKETGERKGKVEYSWKVEEGTK